MMEEQRIVPEIDIYVSVLIESGSRVRPSQILNPENNNNNATVTTTITRPFGAGVRLKLVGDHDQRELELAREHLFQIREVDAATTNGNGYFFDFRARVLDVGKLKELLLSRCNLLLNINDNDDEEYDTDFINEIRVKIPYRGDFQIFPVEQLARKVENSSLVLRANLKPGEKGVHYVISTHTGHRQSVGQVRTVVAGGKPQVQQQHLEIGIQLIGERGKTKLIPLRWSQTNKQHPFVAGRKDVFDVVASDVGRILKVIVENHSDSSTINNNSNNPNPIILNNASSINNWYVDCLEVKTLSNLNNYIFPVNKNLKPNEEIVLEPMTNGEIEYQVLLRTIDFERPERNNKLTVNSSAFSSSVGSSGSVGGGGGGVGGVGGGGVIVATSSGSIGGLGSVAANAQLAAASGSSSLSSSAASAGAHHHHHHHHHLQQRHLIDVYFVITGENGSTKKIYMNNYETKRLHEHEDPKEKYFEFKSEDVGKLRKIKVSINQDDDPGTYLFIDFIEIKIPSKSEAYKFPVERVLGEFYEDGKCELDLTVWKHPERSSHIDYEILTEINDDTEKETMGRLYLIMHGDLGRTGKIVLNDGNYDNNSIDNYEFAAPDVGKLNKIELFFYPNESDATWRLESVEVKLKIRNEAYKFPVQCTLDSSTNYLELIPWKKPNVIRPPNHRQ